MSTLQPRASRQSYLLIAVLITLTLGIAAKAHSARTGASHSPASTHSYLFAWGSDVSMKSSDFLAVIDADPSSPHYGAVLATAPTGVAGTMPHHTEVEMPAGGLLMANGFEAGRTWVYDLHDPLKPKIVATFGAIEGYNHPHTFFRLPNGNVLATFQYRGDDKPKSDGGGLLEIDSLGKLIRAGSAMDPAAPGELIRPYSVELLSSADRVVSTNTAMREADGPTRTVQLWRYSDLHLLRTLVLPSAPNDRQFYPGEPRLLDDGKSVLIHTFNCGLYLMRGIDTDQPSLRYVYGFPGKQCGVPLRLGRYWLQTVPETHSLTVLDISNPEQPREVSRAAFDASEKPHWVAVDPTGTRIVLNSDEQSPTHRLYIVNFDPKTGSVKIDDRFRDPGSDRPGINLDGRTWPHGFHGDAYVHGTVFSR